MSPVPIDATEAPAAAWDAAEAELGYGRGAPLNIGWQCSDGPCLRGARQRPALLWESAQGERRDYTFDDLRIHSNTMASWLARQGVAAGERVCVFMDRIPELYFGFLGILKLGAIAQPLATFIGLVIFMIFAFDRPFRGDLGLEPQPYKLVLDKIMQ